MLQHTVPADVDTRIWNGTPDPAFLAWLGEDGHHFDGTQLVVHTTDGDLYPEPGWTIVRWPDNDLSVMSPRAAVKRLAPGARATATPNRAQIRDVPAVLHEQITAALTAEHYRRAREQIVDTPEGHSAALADAALHVILPATRITAELARDAEANVQRVIALYEQWVKAGAPPLGTSLSRWWDRRLVELRDAVLDRQVEVDESVTASPAVVHSNASPQASAPPRVDDSSGAGGCPQHPTAPVIGGMCGGCTQYPTDMAKEQCPVAEPRTPE